jgi:para-aminobenzoate synthetase/4-amino-4-deoxychorismate lyase
VDFEGLGRRLVFGSPRRALQADSVDEVAGVVRAAEDAAREGAWVVGVLAYEAAPGFDRCLPVRDGCRTPLAWFGVHEAPDHAERPPRMPAFPGRTDDLPPGWTADQDRAGHGRSVAAIRAAIAAGDVYQINHTFRLRAPGGTQPLALYETLLARSPAPYAAYVRLPEHHVLSLSPELFFRRDGARLVTRPMKGTAPRGRWPEEDEDRARWLAGSSKDRAENLMIVDLLRNDLGRVAEVGSVAVSGLFEVERYATVHQMTSTVEARALEGADLLAVLSALFPCGSVTGAPKIAAMRGIAELEGSPREAYCGAVGVLRPGGDCLFNVAIRTLLLDESGTTTYGVGGGVTWSSTAQGEWDEAVAKAAILHEPAPAAALIETLRLEHGKAVRWDAHRARLLASAGLLGHPVRPADLDRAVSQAAAAHREPPALLRVSVDPGGRIDLRTRPLDQPDWLAAAPAPRAIRSSDPWLFHKTDDRRGYEAAAAGLPPHVEPLFWNERGNATEFSRGNLVIRLAGRLVTPPVEAGLLPGILRSELVRAGEVEECDVPLDAVRQAHEVWFVNSARGWVPVRWNPGLATGVGP